MRRAALRTLPLIFAVAAATLVATIAATAPAGAAPPAAKPGSAEQPPDTLRIFDADLGPAFIDVSRYPPEMQANYALFSKRCSKCHTLARPVNSSMKGEEWLAYVTRMSRKAGSGISPKEADTIYGFLVYDSGVRARAANAIDPALLPFLEVSREMGGVPRIAAYNRNVPADGDSLRVEVVGDSRLDVKKLFASGEGQAIQRWSAREPFRAELAIVKTPGSRAGAPPAVTGEPAAPIADAVDDAVGDERDPHEKIELILDWMDETIKKGYVAGTGTPVAILAGKKGDATEFARLFVAMAQGAGVPARTRVGFVAQRTSFHYSAWAEVWLGGRWVAVDPYLGQSPADLGHLAFASQGPDDLAAWKASRYPALDHLKLKVLAKPPEDTPS